MNSKRLTRLGLVTLVVIGAALELAHGTPPAAAAQGSGNPALIAFPNRVPLTGTTTITVIGRDYLVPPHAPGTNVFGGVYLFFGWVRPGGPWGPSIRNSNNNDGTFGVTYSYTGDGGDPGTRDDGNGIMRLVSFTAGGTSGVSTPFHMDDNGNWTTTLKVSATYAWTNPFTGVTNTVDCRQVQCGVYTIGAHGKASATNEKFAPVMFAAATTPATTTPGTTPPGGTNPPPGGTNNPGTTPPKVAGPNPLNATSTTAGTATPGGVVRGASGSGSTTTTTVGKSTPSTTGKGGRSTTDKATVPSAAGKRASTAFEPISTSSESPAPVGWIIAGLVALAGAAVAATTLLRRRAAGKTIL